MLRTPPHILVTTPESLYLLLTAERSRAMLRTVRTVIVDEIHAVIGTRRGAHLALSLERLQEVAGQPLLRHRPVGDAEADRRGRPVPRRLPICRSQSAIRQSAIRNTRHRRRGPSPRHGPRHGSAGLGARRRDGARGLGGILQPADRSSSAQHRTTLIFVNTRRMAERIARHLSERLGEEPVTAHHGSLSKEKRLDAEMRLKAGSCARWSRPRRSSSASTSARVDLVCQIGSPHRIATLLQRRRTLRPHDRRARRRAASSRPRATISSSARRCCARSRRGELDRDRLARRAARRPGAADRRRDGVPRLRRGRALRAGHAARGRIAI